MSQVVRFPVHLHSETGNSFIILSQGVNIDDDGYCELSLAGMWTWRLALRLEAGDPATIDLVVGRDGEITVPHFKTEIHSSGLMHGGADVLVIRGPDFDIAYAEHLKGVAEPTLSE